MEWLIVLVLCLILAPVVYRILKGAISLLVKVVLTVLSIAIVGYAAWYLIQ